MAWDRWQAWLREREQVVAANRELERLDRVVFSRGGSGDGGGYTRFAAGDGIEARPVSLEVARLCVLNVRYLPGLWEYYSWRIGMGVGNHDLKDGGEGVPEGGDSGSRNGDIWRKRVKEATRERVEMAKTREGYTWCGRGRGKLMMLAPFGWDSLT